MTGPAMLIATDILANAITPLIIPPLGDTPFPYMSASARDAAGVRGNWDEHIPVVLNGDGTQSHTPTTAEGWSAEPTGLSLNPLSGVTSWLGGQVKGVVVALAAIVLVGVGAYFLLDG